MSKNIKMKDLLKESHSWERKFGEKLPSLADVQKKHESKQNLKEYRGYTALEEVETHVFDAIIAFKKMFEKSEFKSNSKVKKCINDLLKAEEKLGDIVTELD